MEDWFDEKNGEIHLGNKAIKGRIRTRPWSGPVRYLAAETVATLSRPYRRSCKLLPSISPMKSMCPKARPKSFGGAIATVKERLAGGLLSDHLVNPCSHEVDHIPGLYREIERMRMSYNNLVEFESAVKRRQKLQEEEFTRTDTPKQDWNERKAMSVLQRHSQAPSISKTFSSLFDESVLKDEEYETSSMPSATQFIHRLSKTHGQKVGPQQGLPMSVLVTRPVGRTEYQHSEGGMKAYWKECENLEAKGVWEWSSLVEWDDVAAEANAKGKELHFGYLFGIW